MSAYRDFYLPQVEAFVGRELTDEEKDRVMTFYSRGWHPGRVADAITNAPEGSLNQPEAEVLQKDKWYSINGRQGQYELTTTDGRHCFFMDDTLEYEYFDGPDFCAE